MQSHDKNKHTTLLQKFVNYGRKKFYNIGPRRQRKNKIKFFNPIIKLCHVSEFGQYFNYRLPCSVDQSSTDETTHSRKDPQLVETFPSKAVSRKN
jgi:hypothetical protein